MAGKVKKIKVGDDFHILSVSGPSRMADQVSEQTRRAAARARETAERQMQTAEQQESSDEQGAA